MTQRYESRLLARSYPAASLDSSCSWRWWIRRYPSKTLGMVHPVFSNRTLIFQLGILNVASLRHHLSKFMRLSGNALIAIGRSKLPAFARGRQQ
jgi:hypothetical protein